jgi:predicted DNA-binding WGR domain protein
MLQPTLLGDLTLVQTWGRVGTQGQQRREGAYPDRQAAQPLVERLVRRRLTRRYALVAWRCAWQQRSSSTALAVGGQVTPDRGRSSRGLPRELHELTVVAIRVEERRDNGGPLVVPRLLPGPPKEGDALRFQPCLLGREVVDEEVEQVALRLLGGAVHRTVAVDGEQPPADLERERTHAGGWGQADDVAVEAAQRLRLRAGEVQDERVDLHDAVLSRDGAACRQAPVVPRRRQRRHQRGCSIRPGKTDRGWVREGGSRTVCAAHWATGRVILHL